MEKVLEKKNPVRADVEDVSGKAIRIGLKHRSLLEQGRAEINKDPTYKKKISFTRYIEKLIEDHWATPIDDLKKEREGARDWLEIEYKREAPGIPFYEWVRQRIEGNAKRTAKRNNGGGK